MPSQGTMIPHATQHSQTKKIKTKTLIAQPSVNVDRRQQVLVRDMDKAQFVCNQILYLGLNLVGTSSIQMTPA